MANFGTGIDIGRSGVKIACGERTLAIFPALACPAPTIEEEHEAQRVAALTIVDSDGQPWLWGESARIHGNAAPGNDPEFEFSTEYQILVRAAVQTAKVAGFTTERLALGVPADAGTAVRARVKACGLECAPGAAIRVLAQPAGALAAAAAHRPDVLRTTTAVIDMGRYTTDVAISAHGRPVAGSLASLPGVRIAVDALAAQLRHTVEGTIAFDTLETALRTGVITHRLRRHDVHTESANALKRLRAVFEEAMRKIQLRQPDVQTLLLSGGGADLLPDLPPHVRAPGGRYAVALGLAQIAAGL